MVYLATMTLLVMMIAAVALGHYWTALTFYVLCCINHHYANK